MGRKKSQKNTPQPGFHARIWLEGDEGTFIGFGRAILLEKIREYGSIAKATKEMKMSYKHGWSLLKSMERQAGSPVVLTCRGGKNGGGATLTPTGEQLLVWFWRVQEKLDVLIEQETTLWLKEKKNHDPS